MQSDAVKFTITTLPVPVELCRVVLCRNTATRVVLADGDLFGQPCCSRHVQTVKAFITSLKRIEAGG